MVYFIHGESTKLIKIGKTTDMMRRLRILQTGSPDRLKILAVIKNQASDAPYDAQFRDSWVFGEWFKPSAPLMAFVETLPKFLMPEGYGRTINLSVNPATPRQPARVHKSALG